VNLFPLKIYQIYFREEIDADQCYQQETRIQQLPIRIIQGSWYIYKFGWIGMDMFFSVLTIPSVVNILILDLIRIFMNCGTVPTAFLVNVVGMPLMEQADHLRSTSVNTEIITNRG
jgi:hypothetical protein